MDNFRQQINYHSFIIYHKKDFYHINEGLHFTGMTDHHLSIIHYEKETRTKTDYPEHRAFNCLQHSPIAAVQQFPGSLRLSDDPGLHFCSLDDFHHYFFCHRKKV